MEDVRPPHKVTDYSSSSEESGTTDEEEDDMEQEGVDESTSGPEDARAVLVAFFLFPFIKEFVMVPIDQWWRTF